MKSLVESINGTYEEILDEVLRQIEGLVNRKECASEDIVYDVLMNLTALLPKEKSGVVSGAKDFLDDSK